VSVFVSFPILASQHQIWAATRSSGHHLGVALVLVDPSGVLRTAWPLRFCGLNLQSNGCIELVGIRHFYDFFMCHGRDIIYECLWGMVFHPIIGILMGMWIPMTMDWPFYNVANYPSFDHGPCMYRLITPQLMLGWKVDETMDSYAFAYPLLASKLVNNQTRCGRHLSMNLNLGIDWHNIDVMWWCLIGIGSPKTILRFNNQLQDGIEKKLWVYGNRYHWPKPENHSTNKTNTNCRIAGSVASNHDWLAIAVFTSKNDPIIRNLMALQGS
jgi:hypothetical protein